VGWERESLQSGDWLLIAGEMCLCGDVDDLFLLVYRGSSI